MPGFTPLYDRVIVTPIDDSSTESGIITEVRQDLNKKHQKGTVIFTGPTCNDVKEGDIIFFDRTKTKNVEIEGQKYLQIREENIDGIFIIN